MSKALIAALLSGLAMFLITYSILSLRERIKSLELKHEECWRRHMENHPGAE